MTISLPNAKPLASWDVSKQQRYRATHTDSVLTFHFLLDASPSMAGPAAANLRQAYSMYLRWLQRHAHPMSLAEVRCFSTPLDPGMLVPLGQLQPLTTQTYDPLHHGSGTALYRAVGETCSTAHPDGQHVLIVFTDGGDNSSEELHWTNGKVLLLLQMLQEQQQWLYVFLGAFPEALEVGKSMGFAPGNCLVFRSDKIPDAFQRLQQATQKYLAASPQQRKLLAAGGVF